MAQASTLLSCLCKRLLSNRCSLRAATTCTNLQGLAFDALPMQLGPAKCATVPLSGLGPSHVAAFASAVDVEAAKFKETREEWKPQKTAEGACAGVQDAIPSTAEASNTYDGSERERPPTDMDKVFTTLEEMGLQPGRNCIVGDGLAVVDVGLYLQGVKVALEMEEFPPSQAMVSDARSYALRRTMRSVIQAHGWHPVTLVASDWRKLDSEQKQHYLAYCINHALGKDHGSDHHHHHHHKDGHSCGSGGCGGHNHGPQQHAHNHTCEGSGGCGGHEHQKQQDHACDGSGGCEGHNQLRDHHAHTCGGSGGCAGSGNCGGHKHH